MDPQRLQDIVKTLSVDLHPRSYRDTHHLNAIADVIAEHFAAAGGRPEMQVYEAWGRSYKNVRVLFGPSDGKRTIIGAHYDGHEFTPGADDNASGVAGLIELAYLLGADSDIGQVELVAYSTEEPPFFGSDMMGSAVHAKNITEPEKIEGVIVLEMIGYFADNFGSQDAPSLLIKLLYPQRGNFISVVGNMEQRAFTKSVKIGMKGATDLPVYSVNAPRSLPGIDFSDHRNYWNQELPAVMITDTAFYRNKAYHQDNDTWDRLDYDRMGKVVLGVYSAIKQFGTQTPPP